MDLRGVESGVVLFQLIDALDCDIRENPGGSFVGTLLWKEPIEAHAVVV